MNKIIPKDQEPKVEEPKVEEPKMAELKKIDETADTITAEMPNGEIVEIDKESIVIPEEITSCADHISRTKILDVIESTMARYKGKVVLAMEEVRDIIKAITTAVKE